MIAHDFRNVLQVATSAVRMTRRRLLDNHSELAGTLSDALDALERASSLAERLAAPETPGRIELVAVQAVVVGLRRLLGHALGDAIRLETLVSRDLAPVLCERRQLEDALINLAVNARDAMPDGGVLVIEAVRCGTSSHGPECVCVNVADSGTGMTSEVAQRAFEPSFTTKSSQGSSGLGLHNVRTFATKVGGSVELATSQTSGTRIRLHLPGITDHPYLGAL